MVAEVRVTEDAGFVAFLHVASGVALRIGSGNELGRPNMGGERGPASQFKQWTRGQLRLYDDLPWIPLFGCYSVMRGRDEHGDWVESVDRFVLSKYEDGERVWAWAIGPDPEHFSVQRVLQGQTEDVRTVLYRLPIERQRQVP